MIASYSDPAFARDALPWLHDVRRFARSLTHDDVEADDIVQDTYLRALRSWHTFVPGSNCRRWLFTICWNAFLGSRERRAVSCGRSGGDDRSAGADPSAHPATDDPTDDLLTALELRPTVQRALERVPEPFRSALVLVDMEDQSYESAAATLGVPIGTLRSRLFRGRRVLRPLLLDHARDAGFATAQG